MDTLSQPPFIRPAFSPWALQTGVGSEPEAISSLTDLIRFNAQHNPDHLFCIQAQSAHDQVDRKQYGNSAYNSRSITFRQLEDAVDSCAEWLRNALGSQYHHGETEIQQPVALYLESDVGLFLYLAALQVLDITILLISARLSPPSVQHLLERTKCRTVLVSKRTAALLAGQIDQRFDLKTVESYAAFLYDKPDTRDNSKTNGEFELLESSIGKRRKQTKGDDSRRTLILHSSGTTGFPKPIFLAKRYLLKYASCHQFTADEVIDWVNLSTLPLYHGFGFLAPCLSLSIGMACCFPPSSIIPAGESTLSLLQTFGCRSLMTVPSIIDDLLALDGATDHLGTLEFLAVGGGAMAPEQGVQLKAHGVKLLNHYGVTEIGPIAPIFRPGPDYNWRYLRLRTDLNLELRPIEGSPHFRLVGYPIGWNEPFEVQDELERNPGSSPDHTEIRILRRTDDLIVLKTGEKVMPQNLEAALNKDSFIKTAVCIGQGAFEIVVLIEPSEARKTDTGKSDSEQWLINHVWELISAVNPSLDRHARVSSKKGIIIKPTGKAIPRTDKGSISRRLVHEVFLQEIEAAYVAIDDDLSLNDTSAQSLEPDNVESSIRAMVSGVFAHADGIDANQDLFEQGMDSLQAVRLARYISGAMKTFGSSLPATSTIDTSLLSSKVTADFIYRNPNISALVTAIQKRLLDSDISPDLTKGNIDRRTQMVTLAEEWMARLNDSTSTRSPSVKVKPHVVLLTGATGSLGSHVLACLARTSAVDKVICLYRHSRSSRPQNSVYLNGNSDKAASSVIGVEVALERQKAALSAAGITLDAWCWAKIELVEDIEFMQHHNRYRKETKDEVRDGRDQEVVDGDEKSLLTRLAGEVTHIIHLAWPMDFHRTLDSFSIHFEMVEALIGLARRAQVVRPPGTPRVRLLFSSSIAVVRNYHSQASEQLRGGLNSSSAGTLLVGFDKSRPSVPAAVPESAIESALVVNPMGYAEAKWICEHMLLHAGRTFGQEVDTVVVRIGQISGPENTGGLWKMGEHVPVLVKASHMVGAFPLLDGTISWLPVDRAARSLVEIVFHQGKLDPFMHLENPVRQPAKDVMTIMARELNLSSFGLMPFDEWLQRANDLGAIDYLSEFFRDDFRELALGTVILDTSKSRGVSRTLRGSSGLGRELLLEYVRRWKQQGLFA